MRRATLIKAMCVTVVLVSGGLVRGADGSKVWTFRGADGAQRELTARLADVRKGEAVLVDAADQTIRVPLNGFEETDRKHVLIDRVGTGVVFLEARDGMGNPTGFGSGFVVDESGLVATNYHVIRGAASLEVSFRDSKEKVTVERCVAADRKNDVALLSLEGKLPAGTHVVEIAEAASLQAGTTVWTIGHPNGLKDTVSWGDVNATRPTTALPPEVRQLLAAPEDTIWIQTDAVLARGSSGGPLLNGSGQLVGVNTWIAGPSLGFAVEAKHVRSLMAGAQPVNAQALPLVPNDDEPAMAWMSPQVGTLLREIKEKAAQQLGNLPPQQRAAAVAEMLAQQRSKFLEIAKSEQSPWPRFQALVLVCQFAQAAQLSSDATVDAACTELASQFAESRWMEEVVAAVQQLQSNAARRLLRQCYTKSPHEVVRASAAVALAVNLLVYLEQSDLLSSATVTSMRQYVGQLLADLEKKYSKVEGVNEQLPALRALLEGCKIGLEPPAIRGVDIEGKTFALDEFRGRVIVLDFFADWCPYCKQMYPHERELVEKLKDKPFVLLGINTESQAKLEQLVKTKQVTWRTWADGQEGPIAQSWQVTSFPTLVVIDRNGKIRKIFEGNPGARLDRVIEQLLAEAEGKVAPAEAPEKTGLKSANDSLDRKIAIAMLQQGVQILVTSEAMDNRGTADVSWDFGGLPPGCVLVSREKDLPAHAFQLVGIDAPQLLAKEAIETLNGAESLRYLTLRNFQGGKEIGESLARLKSLRGLSLFGSGCTDEQFQCLAGMRQLESLSIQRTNVGDPSMKLIAGFTSLRLLVVNDTPVTDAGLESLKSLKSLESLHATGTLLKGSGLVALESLPALHTLHLSVSKGIDDQALTIISHLQNLRTLGIADTGVTAQGVSRLQRELPNCQFVLDAKLEDQVSKLTGPTAAGDARRSAKD